MVNHLGEDITDKRIELADSEYGYVDNNNIPHINWGSEDEVCDADGFDKRYRPMEEEIVYVIDDYVIPQGTYICRYGSPEGRFTTYKGTPYEGLGLPYVKETIEYHEYRVSEDIRVRCYVTKGVTAPKFNSLGGAVQFKHKQSIRLECEDGLLQEDFLWIQTKC